MQSRTALAGAAVLAAVLVTAGIAGALTTGGGAPAQVQQQQASMSDTITVTGSGMVQAEADRAVVRLGVLATGDDISAVRERLAENVSQMRDALAEMGIEGDQIRTAHYDISSEARYGAPSEGEPKYRAVHAFVITVNDTGDVGQVIDTAVNNGASEVDGVQFTLSPEKRQQLRQDALESAMESARTEASTLAGAEDLSISGVDRISSTDYNRVPYRVETAALASGDGAATTINSGPVTVSASVTVVYETGS
ncbi:MAG: SIMPL domain-containing protein [Haloarculaceae archaeon]